MKFALALVFFACVGLSLQATHKRYGDNELCDICEQIATFVINLIKDDLPKDEVIEAIEALCDSLPDLKDVCTNKVLPFVEEAYDVLDTLTPEEVCKAITLCN